jgi:uncharacterized protein (UPF0212 family)
MQAAGSNIGAALDFLLSINANLNKQRPSTVCTTCAEHLDSLFVMAIVYLVSICCRQTLSLLGGPPFMKLALVVT